AACRVDISSLASGCDSRRNPRDRCAGNAAIAESSSTATSLDSFSARSRHPLSLLRQFPGFVDYPHYSVARNSLRTHLASRDANLDFVTLKRRLRGFAVFHKVLSTQLVAAEKLRASRRLGTCYFSQLTRENLPFP